MLVGRSLARPAAMVMPSPWSDAVVSRDCGCSDGHANPLAAVKTPTTSTTAVITLATPRRGSPCRRSARNGRPRHTDVHERRNMPTTELNHECAALSTVDERRSLAVVRFSAGATSNISACLISSGETAAHRALFACHLGRLPLLGTGWSSRTLESAVRPRSVVSLAMAGWLTVAAACAGDDDDVAVSVGAPSTEADTTATAISGDARYCGDRTGTELIAEAGALSGSAQPEVEAAWVMSPDGLLALDPELARARTGGDPEAEEVFVVPVADGGGQGLNPRGPTVEVDERTGHTGVVVLDCAGGSALRLLPAGFFPFGEPVDFLHRGRWFTDWTAPDGRPATHEEISDIEWEADDHCSWPNVRMISFGGHQYVRDPDGVFRDWPFETTLDLDAELPGDAVDTGYRNGDVQLWLSEPGDPSAAFLVGPERTERWPRPTDGIHCA
jgi:hypothetical protein